MSRQLNEHYLQYASETRLLSSFYSVTSDSSPEFEYQLQTLARAEIKPNSRLCDADEIRLSAAKRTVDQNYYELDDYIDGDLRTNPVFIYVKENTCGSSRRMNPTTRSQSTLQ